MEYKAWYLAAMEENGYGTTRTTLVNKVARYLEKSDNDIIGNEEFIRACYACNVDPYSFTQSDFDLLQRKLND